MNVDQMLNLAETLRTFAHYSGRDLNAANLFVHDMLLRTLRADWPEHHDGAYQQDEAA